MVSGRAAEVNDFSPVVNEGSNSKNNLFDEARSLTFTPIEARNESQKSATDTKQGIVGDQSAVSEEIAARVKRNGDNPDVQKAYKEFQQSTKDLDPNVVEDCLNLASDLAESGIRIPGMLKAEQGADQNSEKKTDQSLGENGQELFEPRISGALQTLLRKFSNPLVIKDVINVGKDLANIAMSPQGQQLIRDIRSLVVHLKEA